MPRLPARSLHLPRLLGLCAVVSAWPMGCTPEGEEVADPNAPPDACDAATDALADGLQTGDELILAFDCANVGGQLDPLAPFVTTLNVATAPGGEVLADLWIQVINQELTNASGGATTVALTTDDIAQVVGELAGFFESGAPTVMLDLTAEAIRYDVLPEGLYFLREIFAALAASEQAEAGRDLTAFLAAVEDLLCHTGGEQDGCHSNLEQALQGLAATRTETTWDPEDPTNDDLQRLLSWVLYADGDEARAQAALEGVGRALAALAGPRRNLHSTDEAKPALTHLLGKTLPALYGDDLSTPYHYEGYPSRNPRESALYGILLTLADPAVMDAMAAAGPEAAKLVSSYYQVNQGAVGYATDAHTDACRSPFQETALYGTANNGMDQLIRLLVVTDIAFDAPGVPETCQGLMNILLPLVAPYMDLSGSKSIGGLVLELFAQLPLPLIQLGTNIINVPLVVDISNQLCGLNIQYDDTEALQAAVYSENTMNMTLPLLKAINEANQMPALVELLGVVWSTPALCELGPELALAFDPQAPDGAPSTGVPSPLLPDPSAPVGESTHDAVTMPLLALTMDVARHADVLTDALQQGLVNGKEPLARMMFNLGRMAYQPTSALERVGQVQAALSQVSGGSGDVDLSGSTALLDDSGVMYALSATLGSEVMVDALVVGTAETPISLLDTVGERIEDGTVGSWLSLLESVLVGLNDDLNGSGARQVAQDDPSGLTYDLKNGPSPRHGAY